MADLKPGGRLPLLFFGMLSLLGGVLAGLARLGWEVPTLTAQAAGVHGPLMIAAFFGTVISLERAVAIGRGWAYLAPALAIHTGAPTAPSAITIATATSICTSPTTWRSAS